MKGLHTVAWILLIVGGLNWLLEAFGWNLVEAIFGSSVLTTLIYILVGLAAIYELLNHKKTCRLCGSASGAATTV
ncbi:MAG: hypothetical protein UW71_C0015G0005 [Parcubacteria group bacterium GW2011_GWB1_44_7]|nr:MAG: hypothetical protein UW71_C0015G0005 [Parcubacteria group bacterium GW2011_GWB1_44_7]